MRTPAVGQRHDSLTFMLTDLVGSTAIAQRGVLGEVTRRMASIYAAATTAAGGHHAVRQGEGDSALLVFEHPASALAAAVAVQEGIANETWPGGTLVALRSAVLTGDAELIDGDYIGVAVHRCGRLRDIAHGGQVLVAGSTAGVISGAVPVGYVLRFLGECRLRDLAEPERVFQLEPDGGPLNFPALSCLDTRRHNLPVIGEPFVDREREFAELTSLVSSQRLVTVTGPPGVGKTRLALQCAAEVVDRFSDGVCLVELSGVRNADEIAAHVAATTHYGMTQRAATLDALTAELRQRSTLLVLDNCDYVLSGAAEVVWALIQECPKVHVLATSQQGLHLSHERLYRLRGLDLPAHHTSARVVSRAAAVQLFVERARRARPDFAVSESNRLEVMEICQALDGLPLALELAAARAGVLTTAQILETLSLTLDLLRTPVRDRPERHHTLRAAMDWSHDLLTSQPQAVFRRCSVFSGRFDIAAAEAVCTDHELSQSVVLEVVSELVDKSLLATRPEGGRMSYELSATLKRYATEKLLAAGEEQATKARLADYCSRTVCEAADQLRAGRTTTALSIMASVHNDVYESMIWVAGSGDPVSALQMGVDAWRLWYASGEGARARRGLERILALAGPDCAPALRATALQACGAYAYQSGDLDAAWNMTMASLSIQRDLGDAQAEGKLLNNLANIARGMGRPAQALQLYESALEIKRRSGTQAELAMTLLNLGLAADEMSRYSVARGYLEESLDLLAEAPDERRRAAVLHALGVVARDEGDLRAAEEYFRTSSATFDRVGDRAEAALSRTHLADVACLSGRYALGRRLVIRADREFDDIENGWGAAVAAETMGDLALESGRLADARRDYRRSIAAFIELGLVLGAGQAKRRLADVALLEAAFDEADRLLDESGSAAAELGSRRLRAVVDTRRAILGMLSNGYWGSEEGAASGLEAAASIGATLPTADALDVVGAIALADGNRRLAMRVSGTAAEARAHAGAVLGKVIGTVAVRPPTISKEADAATDSEWWQLGRQLMLTHAVEEAMSFLSRRQR